VVLEAVAGERDRLTLDKLMNFGSISPEGAQLLRIIGNIRLNCIVEVEMVFFGDRRPSDPGSANPDTSAVDVAQAMMDKVSELS